MFDYLVLGLLGVFALRGWLRGLVREALDVLTLILGALLAFRLARPVGSVIVEFFEMSPEVAAIFDAIDQTVDTGIPSEEVGEMIRRAILENQFWVLPNAEVYHPVFDAELAELKAGISN